MKHTRWVLVLIRLLPFRSGLSLRLRRHLEECPECLGMMADVKEARTATTSPSELGEVKDIWPRLAVGLERPKPEKSVRMGLGWAVGAAGVVALAIIGAFFLVPTSRQEALSSGVKLRVNYVKMYEQPAQAFVFHTRDANSTFVWVEKQKTGEVI